jgi:MFS family permease
MSNSRYIAWAVWLTASIFYAYQYVLRVAPSIMIDDIMQQFHIGATAFGQFSGVYYIGYSLMHLPIGIMLDRYGPRKVMTGCMLLAVVGLLPLIYSDTWIYPVLGRFLIGIGSSAAILGLFKIIRTSFSLEKFPLMLSISVTIGLLGAIYGGGPVSYLCDLMGYQAVVELFAIAGTVLAIITYCIVPEIETKKEKTVFSDIKEVFCNKRVIFCCIFAGLMIGPLEGFADVWGTLFFKEVYKFDSSLASSLPSMIYLGMCFGAPVLSVIASKVGSYLVTISGAGFAMAVAFFGLLYQEQSVSLITGSFAIVGTCCAYQILALYQASTYVRGEIAGLTTALANMIIMLFGYCFHSIIGALVNNFGGVNSVSALTYGISTIPVALCIGSIGFIGMYLMDRSKVVVAKAS